MIYFLQHKETGLIKIGVTNKLKRRVSQLNKLYGDLELLGLMEGYEGHEGLVHRDFSDLNVRGQLSGDEWFRPEKRLLDYIKKQSSLNFPLPINHRSRSGAYIIVRKPASPIQDLIYITEE